MSSRLPVPSGGRGVRAGTAGKRRQCCHWLARVQLGKEGLWVGEATGCGDRPRATSETKQVEAFSLTAGPASGSSFHLPLVSERVPSFREVAARVAVEEGCRERRS